MASPILSVDFSNALKSKANSLGFQKVGISRAQVLPLPAKRLEMWLKKGHHATMTWMEKRSEERMDIRKYFPRGSSVVSLAMNYYHGKSEGELKISNYAWGKDYHILMKDRLEKLITWIKGEIPDVEVIGCVDTSPVMEKAWAQQSGIGWIGKHTNIITQDFGSWVFLAELILDCELAVDEPFEKDLCGSCTVCIDACPSGAIVDEYVLDANKCISYLTIEHRGEFPHGMEYCLDGWVFGCDICQEVCPWNVKFARLSNEVDFKKIEPVEELLKKKEIDLTREQFQDVFRDSTVQRTRYEGFKRNIQHVVSQMENKPYDKTE